MKTIGFVGTAKNTGKTTTALHVLGLAEKAGLRTALTSIGYDGEYIDHVTGLPKPRYFLSPGMTIATAKACLEVGSAKTCGYRTTGLKTILGEIVIATVFEPGTVVLAGPNRKADVNLLLEQLRSDEIDVTLVDGALNRLAAIGAADGMVISTGAAFDERIEVIANHAAAIESLFQYPIFQGDFDIATDVVSIFGSNGNRFLLDTSSILDMAALQKLIDRLQAGAGGKIWIPGAFSPLLFQNLFESNWQCLSNMDFVFPSAVNLLAAGDPQIWKSSFSKLADFGSQVFYLKPLPLRFMTVNPFYPIYLQKTASYTAAFVDKDLLLKTVRSNINRTLVIDIMQPPHPNLLAQCGVDLHSEGATYES